MDAQARALRRRSSRRAARKAKATATAATSRPSGGARGLWRGSRSLGEAHTRAASACTKPAVLRPQARRTRPASVALEGVDVKQTVCQPTDTPDRDRPVRRTRSPFVYFTAFSPPGARTGARPGPRAGSFRRGASGAGVHLGSTRFFFPKGEAVDLKRHFKGSSILI